MICPYCGKKPNEIAEYVEQANINEMSPTEYVRMDEGTYDLETDLFCCTECYIKTGMPLNIELIKAFKYYRQNIVSL